VNVAELVRLCRRGGPRVEECGIGTAGHNGVPAVLAEVLKETVRVYSKLVM
jgi:hypothetical protein